MKTIKELLAMKEFEDSVEATEFMANMLALLECPAIVAWAKATDSNFATNTFDKLCESHQAFDDFYEEMENAC